ncbi:CooT family nickel-binding protein [Dehalobacterium formicoaceticum]|uniref:CooT family nickel-binding protein n=1 Tax=Dehalobacterium formicoaceticum TaxID=51515 RepID=A0ABT1XZN1_9FIRM|nr:CooT family nickel-binding protein [Dehalobacterium formicoaceticum]MCR6544079.1 CooT family nickel-binding protein [Dehalobacterium formicoaceticum]
MCEANAYVRQDGVEELFLEGVDKVVPMDNQLYLENIFGQKKMIAGTIKELSLVDHKIIIEKI